MSVLRILLVLISIAGLTVAATAQSRMAGTVIKALDGQTLVIDSGGREMTIEIQFIESPDLGQPLYQTVKEHLAKLTVGKMVEFHPRGFSNGRSFGRVTVEKADIAIQLLRDGAAWHLDPEKTGQDASDAGAYAYHQNQARFDGLGVWGIKGMKPASEFRAEKLKAVKEAKEPKTIAVADNKSSFTATVKTQPKRAGPWSDTNPHLKDPGALVHGYNAASKKGYVGTSLIGVKDKEGQPEDHKTAVDITYLYTQEDQGRRTGRFAVTVISQANDWRFLKENTLVVQVDEKKYSIGKPARTTAREDGKLIERLTYDVDRGTIEKIVYGGEVYVKVGNYSFHPTPAIQLILLNMLQVAD